MAGMETCRSTVADITCSSPLYTKNKIRAIMRNFQKIKERIFALLQVCGNLR